MIEGALKQTVDIKLLHGLTDGMITHIGRN
jgi:hypothetical protein